MTKHNTKKNESKEDFIDLILLKKWFYLVITLPFFAFAYICFRWNHPIHLFNKEFVVNHELFGTFGDFFGGFLGTIFTLISVLLVVRTFRHQQTVTRENLEQQKTQRFNNLFFELLHLYQSEVKDLCGQSEIITDIVKVPEKESIKVTKEHVNYDNKDFFDEEKLVIQRNYKNQKSYEKNRVRSINYYMLFYIENRSKIAAYFRTLYRIYELIDKSELITESQKKEYSKIMRAQLTESELFFLRYNALTAYGDHFVEYINKYHILKHLPAFELLEFKDWWEDMNRVERESVNILYYFICEAMKELFKTSKTGDSYEVNILPQENARFQISLLLSNNSDFSINVKKYLRNTNMANEYRGLDKLEDIRIQQLLDCFIKEIFLFSNFNQFNDESEIETYSSPIAAKGNIVEINSGIRNIKNNPLKYLY